jgi:hypothetical protein
MPNVSMWGNHDVAELMASSDHSRVTGARVVNRDGPRCPHAGIPGKPRVRHDLQ